jgi:hypothetical protein
MIPTKDIPRPQGLREEILQSQRLVEYYSEPAMPGFREFWRYLVLVERHDANMQCTGAGAVCDRNHGLVQTLSFTGEEMHALRRQLEGLSIPVLPSISFALDGSSGFIRFYNTGTNHVDLQWGSCMPDEWQPVHDWINTVWKMIDDKAFEEAFDHRPEAVSKPHTDQHHGHAR